MPTQAPKENFGDRADAPANSDQDEVARLTQMRDRLVSLTHEARSMRAQIPSEFEGDVAHYRGIARALKDAGLESTTVAIMHSGRSSISSVYGAMGSLVIVLVWVYYSAQILFFGAQFTRVYASRFGVKPQPIGGAEFVPTEAKHRPKAVTK